MAATRKLVVAGATGKQGGALVAALLAKPNQPFEIYAITRNRQSGGAQKLAKMPNVKVIEGDFRDPAAIFKQVQQPWGLFSMTMPMNPKTEEQQGKALAQAALAAGVQHIVFTATDRGANTETDPTPIPHFASKFAIEKDMVASCQTAGATYTFLRPVAFMENFTADFFGKAFVSMWRLSGPGSRMQLVSTVDVGKVAADAFLHADSPEYLNQAISLAGDDITEQEVAQIFREQTGKPVISTYSPVARALKWVLHKQLGIMLNWIRDEGFGVDVPALKERYPFIKDFRAWLREESAWKKM